MRSTLRHPHIAGALVIALIAVLLTPTATTADALQTNGVVINEVVSANDSFQDNYGATPDWIELQNNGSATVNLAGWTISDDGGGWTLPPTFLASGARLVIFASGRDEPGPPLHTSFSLKRAGETVQLANPNGALVDSLAVPELADDQAYGRSNGGLGILLSATPGQPNSNLAPSSVTITTPPQTFEGALAIQMTATTAAGQQVRYTTDSTPVVATSPVYSGPFAITTSTVIRAAVVGNGVIGPESSAGYTALSSTITNFSSDLPIVLVHSTGAVGTDTQDAIVTIIDRDPVTGRATPFGTPDYNGFAGLRIRGASSTFFPKKQYKFETWGDRLGNEVDANVLGMGSESDWGLYAPGRFDRAMINNPLMYELGKRIGVVSPDYQFVELFIEDNPTATVGDGDYLGLYVLRESIKIDDSRVDIQKHTSTSAGPDGGYILRYDWADDCCVAIAPTRFNSVVAVDSPSRTKITTGQRTYIDTWWDGLVSAATGTFADVDPLIDFDSFIDHWLLEILALDPDVLRASHYFHLDAGGQLMGGPLWDYDRALGSADIRVNELSEAEGWQPNITGEQRSGHSYLSDVYEDLWGMPEVQARLRARWAQLRAPGAPLSDSELQSLILAMGAEITEAYGREDARWGATSGYGPRFGGGLSGEISHINSWVQIRTNWLDDQFLSTQSPPVITVPAGGIGFQANVAVSYQVQASDNQTMVFAATGLPEGLSIDSTSGLISGTVGYGDSYGSFPVQVTVTDSSGASATAQLVMTDAAADDGPSKVILNEYNAVSPGKFLADGGSDTTFGVASGNGGDWFEIVTIEDNLDLRGWRFEPFSNNDNGDVVQTAALILGQQAELANVRAGTIITVAESVPEDLSYDPGNDDWTINLQANNAGSGAWWFNQTNFDTNHKRWRLVVREATGTIAGYIGGETEAFRGPQNNNVNSTQVMGLSQNPSATAQTYAAGTASTFGAPNVLPAGGVQNFDALRPALYVPGDADCDQIITLGDALVIAQYTVSIRTDSGGCPMSDPSSQLNVAAADADGSGFIDVGDALLVAQCTVSLPNELCPQ